MKRKKAIMLIMAAALVCQPMTALADAAPLPPLFLTSSDEDMLADQTTHFAEFLRARGAAFELDFRPKNADKNAHRYEHIYPVKHPEWEECAELIDRACAFMRRY